MKKIILLLLSIFALNVTGVYAQALTKKELKELGFKQYCTYSQMVPEFHDL